MLVRRGCLIPFEEVRTIDAPVRPSVIIPLCVEPSRSRLIYDARLPNTNFQHVGFSLDSLRSVAGLRGKVAIKDHSMTSQASIR